MRSKDVRGEVARSIDEIVRHKLPLRLFKYREVNTSTEQLLSKHQIYCSDPTQFNDPFECRPLFELDVDNAETTKWLKKGMSDRGITNPSKRFEVMRRMKHAFKTPRTIEDIGFDKVLKRVGIYSLTADPASLLMWSHYANAHKGICIEFSTEVWPFNLAWKVVYSAEYPVVNRVKDAVVESLNKSVLTKAESWSYEQEWRLVMRTPDQFELDRIGEGDDDVARWTRMQHGPGIYDIPPESITGVILGARMSDSGREQVISWMRTGNLKAELRQARQSRSQFRLEIEILSKS